MSNRIYTVISNIIPLKPHVVYKTVHVAILQTKHFEYDQHNNIYFFGIVMYSSNTFTLIIIIIIITIIIIIIITIIIIIIITTVLSL